MKFKGNPPRYGELVGEHGAWDLWLLESSNDEWSNLKLVLRSGRVSKANYLLGYLPHERRWAGTADMVLLQERQPELIEFLNAWVCEYFGHGDAP